MSDQFRVRCNRCQSEFSPRLEVIPQPDGGERQSFACWNCGRTYDVAVISPKGIELRRQLAALEQSKPRHAARIQRLRAELAREVRRPHEAQ